MKKIICAVLCLIICLFALTSCGEDLIGEVPPSYEPHRPKPVEKISLNMYIVCGDETTDNAKKTVAQRITQYTEDKFNTNLVVYFVSESDYATTIAEKTAVGAENRADIILINSEDMFNSLKGANLLADLSKYYEGNTYGKLNVSINSALLEMSRVDDGKLYTVPNNHHFGEYKYIKVSVDVAKRYYKSAQTVKETYTTPESIEELKTLMRNDTEMAYTDEQINSLVCVVSGRYEDKAAIEASGFYCNVSKAPVATTADAFASAFAIVAGSNVDRAMEIVYDINGTGYKTADKAELRNLLQYGILGTNYLVDEESGDIIPFTDGNNVYSMNLNYTGDVFKAMFCEEIGWTKVAYDNTKKHIDAANN